MKLGFPYATISSINNQQGPEKKISIKDDELASLIVQRFTLSGSYESLTHFMHQMTSKLKRLTNEIEQSWI